MKNKKRRIRSIMAGILAVALVTIFVVGIYYISIMKKTIQQVASVEGEQSVYSVYVLKEDPAAQLQDISSYRLGFSADTLGQKELEQAMEKMQDSLGKQSELKQYDNLFLLVDGLKEQSCRAILLNDAYVESIVEAEGYEWVTEGIRKINSLQIQQEEQELEVPQEIPETFIMYLSGIDTYGGITARSRSDVNILAIVNTKTGEILMLSTPRDFYVEFSATKGEKDKLTHAGIYGIEQSMDALERLYDIKIDYYLKMNFTGFINIIDAIGGIEVYSDYDFSVENIKEYHKGYNQLNGLEALAFARERYSFAQGDYQRGKNQMEVIRAVIDKCSSPAILKNYRKVMEAVAGSFETNMPEEQITFLITRQIFQNRKWSVSSYTTQGSSASRQTFSMPGKNLFVILPGEESVKQAKEMIRQIHGNVP